MRILKWTPFFDVKEESPIVPIWISFPNLRLHFFNAKVLHALGSIFGRPLQTDKSTASRTRPSVARVLVEVDITKKHAKEVWMGSKAFGYLQKVEFEKVPDFCNHCKTHGHAISKCFKLHPELKKHSNNSLGKEFSKEEADSTILKQNEILNPVETVGNENLIVLDNDIDVVKTTNLFPLVGDSKEKSEEEVDTTPKIFISVDSMLKFYINLTSYHNIDINAVENDKVDDREEGEFIPPKKNCTNSVDDSEEGEFIPPKKNCTNSVVRIGNNEKGVFKDNEVCSNNDSSSAFTENNTLNIEEEEAFKVQKKKKKNGKAPFPDTPCSTRAQALY
ncbi:hypothetical protein MA16_Dca023458 [Dendrobium catenatum]|uniref:Uncharacterized protein n=1 Tax=Dendrobium catenatum TaxID=906689 RepID=A0A2I0V873_9ASPA|nr:hypothetical protein MA16_Dca023458 [Dendrobium catenatum]